MSRALALVETSDESRKLEASNARHALLETKLYVPRTRSGIVARPRLFGKLKHATSRRLTVIVAPAGFGKTTLTAEWLAERFGNEHAAGWVSLDPSENESALFWAYFISALQKVQPGVGVRALTQLRSTPPATMEAVLTTLINEVDAIDADFTIVLDDYHVIDAQPVHAGLTFLLDHLPARMHLVIASRSEPPLPLPRLRARGELTELRATDLRFTLEESSTFLNDVMELSLSPNDTAELERRTEGWIAGLKLAALSMQSRSDDRSFVQSFSGDNRFIADYLVEEVLNSESAHVRQFLLGTAMLDRLSGSLCDAVRGGTGSQALLEELERRNLFVVALDDRREWFRYHHLFASVLQRHIARDPETERLLHGRASLWYEEHGTLSEAVRHALSADDLERAAGLLERSWPGKDRSYESASWLTRVKALPDSVLRDRPVLSMGYAWALLNSGELEAAEPRLRNVERLLHEMGEGGERTASTRIQVDDEERFNILPAELAAARVYLAQALGEVPGSLEHAQRALELVPEGDIESRATALALLALALWGRGELESAYGTFAEALTTMRVAGHELDEIRGIFVLGDIRVAQGRLHEAVAIYERGLRIASETTHPALVETDELFLGLSEVHREWNDVASAREYLDAIARSAAHAGYKGNKLRLGTAAARLCEALGNVDGAFELLTDAERHERRDPLPRVRPIPAMKARIRLAQGKVDAAQDWAAKAQISIDDDLSYVREFEHVTLARLLIVRSAAEVLPLLERLRSAAHIGGRMGSVIEILVLQSRAQYALGNSRAALDALAQALTLAEPEGFLRVFLDEGQTMRDLLRTATARGLAGAYTRRVLSAFDEPPPSRQTVALPRETAAGVTTSLTTRELEILRLIAAGLRNQEIADHLAISAATVKRHIANAYLKLGAGHRTEALARAAELKLL